MIKKKYLCDGCRVGLEYVRLYLNRRVGVFIRYVFRKINYVWKWVESCDYMENFIMRYFIEFLECVGWFIYKFKEK